MTVKDPHNIRLTLNLLSRAFLAVTRIADDYHVRLRTIDKQAHRFIYGYETTSRFQFRA